MKHLKKFNSLSEYNTFVIGESYVLPNVSWIVDTDDVKYQSIIKMKPGDVVYYNNGLKVTPLGKYSEDLGVAVGVITIPNNFLPDGKARMVALYGEYRPIVWNNTSYLDTDLTNYTMFPTSDDYGLTTHAGTLSYAFHPSNYETCTGEVCATDPNLRYHSNCSNAVPSPYLADGTLNPDYIMETEGNNPVSYFDGRGNTYVLTNVPDNIHKAANAACFATGDSNNPYIQWYLPSAGECGVSSVYLGTVENTIKALGGTPITDNLYWTSTEYSNQKAYFWRTGMGGLSIFPKDNTAYYRPFALVE